MDRRVLVVEDERDLNALIAMHLRDLGCTVATCWSGTRALERALSEPWGLIVLDLLLPDIDGLEICRRVRLLGDYVPILMLTARSAESDRVLGLDAGADDYLTKPFGITELMARVRAILRRVEQLRTQSLRMRGVLRMADLEIDLDGRVARREGRSIDLTSREFDLLAYLASHPGQVFSRAQLLDQVWGNTHEAFEHAVSSHVNRLRAKVENDPTEPRYVQTVWGAGYRFGCD